MWTKFNSFPLFKLLVFINSQHVYLFGLVQLQIWSQPPINGGNQPDRITIIGIMNLEVGLFP